MYLLNILKYLEAGCNIFSERNGSCRRRRWGSLHPPAQYLLPEVFERIFAFLSLLKGLKMRITQSSELNVWSLICKHLSNPNSKSGVWFVTKLYEIALADLNLYAFCRLNTPLPMSLGLLNTVLVSHNSMPILTSGFTLQSD